MDDIIKNKKSSTVKGSRKKVKVKSEEESSSGEDMLAVLTKERDKKSIPNNFQERNNDKEVKEPVSKIKKQNFIRVVDNAPKKRSHTEMNLIILIEVRNVKLVNIYYY